MDSYIQIAIKFILIVIHFIGVVIVTLIILFSEDPVVLGAIIICQSIVFYQLIINDGCMMSKCEWLFGGDFNLTDLGKKIFFLSDGLKPADFEKMIVGVPLLLCIMKLCLMMMPKHFLSKVQKKYMSFAHLRIPRTIDIVFRLKPY